MKTLPRPWILLPFLLALAGGCTRETTETTTSDTTTAQVMTTDPAASVGGVGGTVTAGNGATLDSSRLGAPGDSSADVVPASATLDGLRAQVREHRATLGAAVRGGNYTAVEREAIILRDLIVALAGRAKSGLDAQQTIRLEQQMHDVSDITERLRIAAHERRNDAIGPAHRELEGLVTLVLELTGKAT